MRNQVLGSVRLRWWRVRGLIAGAAIRPGTAALAIALVAFAPTGWAQTEQTEAPARETGAAERAARAAGEALEFGAGEEGAPVTYADVLRDPDNIELNFRFARTQVRAGNVRGSAATLERILLINPDLAQVRLFYAVVLFRLDNVDEAEREFRAVAALDIADDVRAEVDAYLARIKRRRQTTRYTASLSIGAHYDSNRPATPRSGTRLFFDIPIDVGREESDVGYLGIARLRVDHDLGYQERHELFGVLTYYHDEQVQQDTQDLQSFIVEAGGVYRSPFWGIDVVPTIFRTHLRLSRETFFQDIGVNLRFEREFTPKIKAFASTRFSDQTFSPINETTTAQEQDGRQIEGRVGAAWAYSPTMRISGDLLHFDKRAKGSGGIEFFSYDRDRVRLEHAWLLGEGQFLLNLLSYQLDRYDEPDATISARTRRDDIFRYRVTYGAPLGFFFGAGTLWREIEDITFTASGEWFRANSNIANFDYDNLKVQGLLTKTWRF